MNGTKSPPPNGPSSPSPHAPADSPKGTDPLPVDVSLVTLAPSSAITALQEVGGELQLEFAPTKPRATLGSAPVPHVDLTVPRQYVSRLHATIDRCETWIVVTNHSQNGTFFRGRDEPRNPVKVGESFTVGETELLALDDFLVTLREQLRRHIGFGALHKVDAALVAVADEKQPPLLLSGPRGSEPARLARYIHDASPRRAGPFEVIEDCRSGRSELSGIFARAKGGSIFVDLAPLRGGKASGHLTEWLFGPEAVARPIVAAPSMASARGTFDIARPSLTEIAIPPIKDRPQDVGTLIDLLLAELESSVRIDGLPPDRHAAVCAFDWPINHADLRRNAPRLRAYLENGCNLSAAARALGVNDSGLGVALGRIGAIVRQGPITEPRRKR